MTPGPFSLERSILIVARRDTVFSFFTDSERFARWWGAGSRIDGRPGGAYLIRYPNGATASGSVLELEPPGRVVLSYGYDDPGKPIPPGGSRVTITLEERPDGTMVRLRHDVDTAAIRDAHDGGWRYQLAIFAHVGAAVQVGDVDALVDQWLGAWAERDAAARRARLANVVDAAVSLRDRYGATSGLDELNAHLGAMQMFMPGHLPRREGPVTLSHSTALVAFAAVDDAGAVRARGSQLLDLTPQGTIGRVVGFWNPR